MGTKHWTLDICKHFSEQWHSQSIIISINYWKPCGTALSLNMMHVCLSGIRDVRERSRNKDKLTWLSQFSSDHVLKTVKDIFRVYSGSSYQTVSKWSKRLHGYELFICYQNICAFVTVIQFCIPFSFFLILRSFL